MAGRKAARKPMRVMAGGTEAAFGLSEGTPVLELDMTRIHRNPDQPRRTFDDASLDALADSIERYGLLEPVLVRQRDDGGFDLVAGERRLRAHELLNRETILARPVEGAGDEIALVENLQREDLNLVELADALGRLVQRHGYSHAALAEVIGRSKTEITRLLGLLRLPEAVRRDYTEQRPDITKSVLMEIAEVEEEALQHELWEAAMAGATVQKLRRLRHHRSAEDQRKGERRLDRSLKGLERQVERLHKARDHIGDNERDYLRRIRQRIDTLLGEA